MNTSHLIAEDGFPFERGYYEITFAPNRTRRSVFVDGGYLYYPDRPHIGHPIGNVLCDNDVWEWSSSKKVKERVVDTPSDLSDYIYIYFIKEGELFYDRSVARIGLGPDRAKQRVKYWEGLGYESFYSIGTLPRTGAYS